MSIRSIKSGPLIKKPEDPLYPEEKILAKIKNEYLNNLTKLKGHFKTRKSQNINSGQVEVSRAEIDQQCGQASVSRVWQKSSGKGKQCPKTHTQGKGKGHLL